MRWRDASRLDWQMIALWGPVVAVAALNQAGVGLENAWTGSSLALSLTSVLLAGPLLLRVERPSWAATLVAGAIVAQEALGGSLGLASFIAVLLVAYSGGRHLPTSPPTGRAPTSTSPRTLQYAPPGCSTSSRTRTP